jgi:hypothetical protein
LLRRFALRNDNGGNVIAGMGKGFGKGRGIKVEIAIGNKIEVFSN